METRGSKFRASRRIGTTRETARFLRILMVELESNQGKSNETESDKEENETSAFILAQYNRMFTIGKQIMQWRLGVKHWYEDGDGTGPDSTELNARLTFLFPQ